MPLRKFMQFLKWLSWLPRNFGVAMVTAFRGFVSGVYAWLTFKPGIRKRRMPRLFFLFRRNRLLAWPLVKGKMISFLQRFPRVKARLIHIHNANTPEDSIQYLSPQARKIYADIQLAVKKTPKV